MTEKDIMKAFGDIKEEYIDEAAPERWNKQRTGRRQISNYLREYGKVWSAVAAAVVLMISFGVYRNVMQGDFSSSSTNYNKSDTTGTTASDSADAASDNANDIGYEGVAEDSVAESIEEAENSTDVDGITSIRVQCASLVEAEDLAGFGLVTGGGLNGYELTTIYAVKQQAIELGYENEDGTARYWITKVKEQYGALTDWTIQDGNVYDVTEVWDVDGVKVTMEGDEIRFTRAAWQTDGYTYMVEVDDITLEQTAWDSLLRSIR
ncbi:MAG: hypothetical protein IJ833_06985 [Lachnospiraceae bacterium]|nr:hypothetical protein [Lachnospiraceae bacterium]